MIIDPSAMGDLKNCGHTWEVSVCPNTAFLRFGAFEAQMPRDEALKMAHAIFVGFGVSNEPECEQ